MDARQEVVCTRMIACCCSTPAGAPAICVDLLPALCAQRRRTGRPQVAAGAKQSDEQRKAELSTFLQRVPLLFGRPVLTPDLGFCYPGGAKRDAY